MKHKSRRKRYLRRKSKIRRRWIKQRPRWDGRRLKQEFNSRRLVRKGEMGED